MTVVGIAPPGFFGDRIRSDPPELWLPLAIEPIIERENSLLHVHREQLALSGWTSEAGRRHGASSSEADQ